MKLVKGITNTIAAVTEALSAAGLAVTALCLFLQVVLREMHITAMWAGEFARYGFMVTVFYGFAAVTHRGQHLVITLIQDKMSARLRGLFLALMKLTFAALFGVLAYGMWLAAVNAATNNQTFESFTGVNISIVYYIVFAGYAVSALNGLLSGAGSLYDWAKGVNP